MDLWDDESWHLLSIRFVDRARDAGALAVLPVAVSSRVGFLVNAGELAAAASMTAELEAINVAAGSHLGPYAALALAGWRGGEGEATDLIDANLEEMVHRGEGIGLGLVHQTRAFLYNCAGRYEEALAAAEKTGEFPVPMLYARWGLVELIEAAARCGKADRAGAALVRLSETTRASGTDWALGIEARSRALMSEGDAAEDLYREAIDRLGRTRVRLELARSQLLYGEWLRRESRRLDAREQLRAAHDTFSRAGSEAFAERAARELLATGETARKRTADTPDELTAQEGQVARLARDGLSNPEIGAHLYISPRTVEYHLHKVFAKLDINSRKDLKGVLPATQA
jgi:ATP/maltotriose-dependent transcriptional regulator MalT